ncbi:MAG: glycosyl hydrolase family 18 protein [Terracidiphilus sp.]
MALGSDRCKLQGSWPQKRGIALLLAVSTITAASVLSQTSPPAATPLTPRLVGYLFGAKGVDLAESIKSLDLSRVTDLNLAFGDPPKCEGTCTAQSDMTFSIKGQQDADVDAVITAAHAAGVKVFLSVGGGGGDQMIIQFYNAGLSAPLVASLDQYIRAHHFDGVDVDIEDPANMGQPFASFVSLLTFDLHAEGKLVTAAVAKYLQASMPGSALHQFDFINVMNYSSYADAVTALQFYAQDENVPKDKIVLGVPFFASNAGDSKEEDYNTILAVYPNARKVNLVGGGTLDDGQGFYYVGEETMAQETQLGKQYGGIMVWHLLGDAPAPHSLLKVIEKNL